MILLMIWTCSSRHTGDLAMTNDLAHDLNLQFEAHGGTVVDQLAKGVTHILMVPQGEP